jgi:valyl-tRNA synthetase
MKFKDIKNWGPKVEGPIVEKWKKEEKFKISSKSNKKIYSIDTPPPYVNAPIHIGQAVTYCYMDFFARFKRMKGFDVLFPLGLDRNGLPIEMAAEKEFNVNPFRDGRDKFLEACHKLLQQTSTETQDTFAKLGISFTSYKEGDHIGAVYKTDKVPYRKLTQQTFLDLFKRGLIYEDKRINNWDPKLKTTIADSEIEYKELGSEFTYVLWKIKETGQDMIIGTTRPELICTCGMVIFHPDDKRYKKIKGLTAISPIFGKEVKIQAHPIAQMDKGTGLAMMCSAGDLSDIQFFREMKIKPMIAINQDGKMNDLAGPLKGLTVKEARAKIISLLKEKKLIVKQEKIVHRTPISERSGAEIEFIGMPEYYLKQIDSKSAIKNISQRIKFYPPTARKILDDWIDSVSIDWPISRRRFYATPIPLWTAEINKKKAYALAEEGKYCEPWKEKPKRKYEVYQDGKKIGTVGDFKDVKWQGETRVLDTWMDSSISELHLLKYKEDDDFFKRAYPCSLRPQGKEIIRTWLYYSLLRGYLETGIACFEDVWINQHITDAKGYKMSKSTGNVVDPQKLLKNYGGEAIRFWAATEGDLSKQDLRCSEIRIKGEMKTLNKLLNLSRFVMLFDKPKKKPSLAALDELFIDYIEDLTQRTEQSYDKYDFYHPAIELRRFLWDIFASHYVEMVKPRAYNQDNKFTKQESDSAKWTLYYLLERLLLLSYPIIPQITSTIADELKIDSFHYDWPKIKIGKSDLKNIDKIMEFNSWVWKQKKERKLSLKSPVQVDVVPIEIKLYEKDLIACHKLVVK